MNTIRKAGGLALLAVIGLALFVAAAGMSRAQERISVMAKGPAAFHPWPFRATLGGPTDRYPHNVLGSIPGFGELFVEAEICRDCPEPRRVAGLFTQ